jgi:hypothetical protein
VNFLDVAIGIVAGLLLAWSLRVVVHDVRELERRRRAP